ncbi:MAG TPA: type II secretion system F family protein, partial [Ignavibacteriales bacterium]|nr:type II secretion system F family protein [Ignavibacteriales bacterium]
MFGGISEKEIIEFNKTFSIMLLSRLSILQSLEIIHAQTKNEKFKEIIKKIISDIKTGAPLSKSFAKHPEIFSDIYVANLRVAEESGQIAEVIEDYTKYLEGIQDLK